MLVTPALAGASPTVLAGAGVNMDISINDNSMTKHGQRNIFMKQRYSPYIIGASLLISGSIITGLANADIETPAHKRAKVMAKKLDTNNDGLITLDELTSRQDRRFQHLDRDRNGTLDKSEFNARMIAMFNRMDINGDGALDDNEMSQIKQHHHGKMNGKTGQHNS
jgi:Ca2+-binding EF-hand superfamily protein